MNRIRCFEYWFIAIFIIGFVANDAKAANYVTVATIGNRLTEVDQSQGMQKGVEQVIGFWQAKLEQVLPDKPDLIVLPELCDRPAGLTKEKLDEYYGVRKKQVLDFFASVAKENHCYIIFGTKWEAEDGVWRNSSILLDRKGKVAGVYHKNFPTIWEIESGIVPGKEATVFECDFGTVACAICYDLNFTELCESYAAQKPDILAFSSMYHGGLMQEYWAYQCRSFFVGATGFRDVPSEIRNPLGEVVGSNTNYFDFTVATINLDCKLVHLDYNMDKLTKLKEKYGSKVIITDPGRLGSVLVSSEHENISAEEMIKEFGIELLDDYFERSRVFREQRFINN
ncbi:carbon-nitrogen hydrolase family protein [Mariniphaga sediminis]|uniref:Carbon-nitrogen hydrolase family protein n=1 Tax=Mariniphaga sediminis TaxID=1628158 RepID=A0A399CWL1_9BACT|nr:carbon-nitrogen hydrolase family protein [Mariniphaga sediminis]RIH62801.1 carbon-nitrogen hydrolase family protein [Mariniphaga sediminis]